MKVRDVRPGTHFRRPGVNDGTRELVKLANVYDSGNSGAAHFSFDPKNFELIGSQVGSSEAVPIEAKRPETRNHVPFSNDELRLIEAVLSNTRMGQLHPLGTEAIQKIREFLPDVDNRPPYTLFVEEELTNLLYGLSAEGM